MVTTYAISATCRNPNCHAKISFAQATGQVADDDINSFEEKTIVCPICHSKFRCTRDNLTKAPVRSV